MPATESILDPPSSSTEADLDALREELQGIPAKEIDRNVLIGTWNLREFGRFAQVWDQAPGHKPFRDLHAIRCIGEVVSRFDVVAIQEVQEDITALQALMKWLGSDWGLIMTDVTRGKKAGGERLAFLFDTRRVKPSGLAGELVLSAEQMNGAEADGVHRQFARTPYAVSFISHGLTFILTTVHIVWGKSKKERTPEIKAIADWLADWSHRIDTNGHDLLVLGDFNIDRRADDANQKALIATGLTTPPELDNVARTVSSEDGADGTYYDQIAWFPKRIKLRYTGRAGRVKWKGRILAGIDPNEVTFRISDHYPLWAEFAVSETDPT
jgi:endonuclease/exonuclease/phosphatase family metal-dependent hydrolase